jgi:hypothetical protein
MAEDIDSHNGAGAGGDPAFEVVGVEVVGVGLDLDEDGGDALEEEGVDGGGKGEGGDQHLVPGSQVERTDDQVECGGAGADGDGVLCADIGGEGCLEGGGLGPEGEAPGAQDLDDRLDVGVGDLLGGHGDGLGLHLALLLSSYVNLNIVLRVVDLEVCRFCPVTRCEGPQEA